jgi:hypothetical protein
VLLTPNYLELRACVITTLRAFPEAARAVSQAYQLEAKAAEEIQVKPNAPLTAQIEHKPNGGAQ